MPSVVSRVATLTASSLTGCPPRDNRRSVTIHIMSRPRTLRTSVMSQWWHEMSGDLLRFPRAAMAAESEAI